MNIQFRLPILLVLLDIFMLSGCKQPVPDVIDTSEPLYFERIGMGQTGSEADTIEVLVRTEKDWDEWKTRVNPLAPFRKVDFTQAGGALIAVPVESGGYTVEVESVEKDNGIITISYLFSKPKSDCISPLATALPFQAVLIRRAEGEVRFERREERYGCDL